MRVENTGTINNYLAAPRNDVPNVIDHENMKAILSLGLKGNLTVPEEEHEVDILV